MVEKNSNSSSSLVGHSVWRACAIFWLLIVLGGAVHQWHFWQHPILSTDVMALLPKDESSAAVSIATERMSSQASRKVVVAIGAKEWEDVERALVAWRSVFTDDSGLAEHPIAQAEKIEQSIAFYAPYRDRLLTSDQRDLLKISTPSDWVSSALMTLIQPGPTRRVTTWSSDPLGLWPQWWATRAGDIRARLRNGEAYVTHDGLDWAVLVYESDRSAMSFDGEPHLRLLLARATAASLAVVPDVRLLQAGIPLHAEAAAVQAHGEVNTIGWGSLAAVMALLWLAFRAFRPILLTALSLLVGIAMATSATVLVFGQIHIVTLIFGSSLIGVAEDYGIHYFSARQATPDRTPMALIKILLPGLLLALLTSVLGYWVLGFAPFPGLRQMATFSAVGLGATFITAVLWFPWLDGLHAPVLTPLAYRVSKSLKRWPRLSSSIGGWTFVVFLVMFAVLGLIQLSSNDDLRQLQVGRSALIAQQREMSSLLELPSPTQYYVIKGHDAEEVLQREEALKVKLDRIVSDGSLQGYRALSDWIPSKAQQESDALLTAKVETVVIDGVAKSLGEVLKRDSFSSLSLTLPQWLANEVSRPARNLWLGDVGGDEVASVLMLRGELRSEYLSKLSAVTKDLDGVIWIDSTAKYSNLLATYRVAIGEWLVLGHILIFIALSWRFKGRAWRAWLPTFFSTILTFASLGWLGYPIQLFHILAFVLLLGVGIDYGIFLLEHPDDGGAWLAVILGSLSTVLSFGLLGLSQVPPLRAFGVTVLIGLSWVLLLTPLLRLSHRSELRV